MSMKKKTQVTTTTNDQALTTIVILFHFLLFATPLFFTFNTSELFEFNKMILTYAITVLIAGAWLTRMVLQGQVIVKRTYLDIPIILFVISQLLSTIFSIHPATSLLGYYSRFHGGLLSTITYVVLYYAFVSNIKKKHLPALFITAFTSGLVVSLYATLEHFGHSFSCFMVDNGKSFGVDCWIQDVKSRVFASFGQPNWLAAYLIMLIPVGTALVLQLKQKPLLRYVYSGITLLFFLVLLYTRSRSGFFGLAVGMAVFGLLVVLKWQLWKIPAISEFTATKKIPLALLISGILIVVALNGTPLSPSIAQLSSPSQPTQNAATDPTAPVVNRLDNGGTDSGEIREIVWKGAINVWKRYPVLGSGVETFAYSYYLDRPVAHNLVSEWDFLYNKAHNEFLNFLATTGVVGLISYVVLLGWCGFFAIRKIFKADTLQDSALLLIAVISSIIALSVSNFFGFSTVMVTILMYLYFGIVSIVNDSPLVLAEAKTAKKNASETSYLFFSIIAMACVFLLNMVYQYWKADVLYSKGSALLDAGYFQEGMADLQAAIKKNPGEAEFYDELATQYSRYAFSLAQQQELQDAQTLMALSMQASDTVLILNPRQLNFYKTRAGVYITLAQMNADLLHKAKETLQQGVELAPTDAKLLYNLGVVEISLDEKEAGRNTLEKVVEMKPNYEAARIQLANVYEELGNKEAALEQLQFVVKEIAPHNQAALDKIASLSATPKK